MYNHLFDQVILCLRPYYMQIILVIIALINLGRPNYMLGRSGNANIKIVSVNTRVKNPVYAQQTCSIT